MNKQKDFEKLCKDMNITLIESFKVNYTYRNVDLSNISDEILDKCKEKFIISLPKVEKNE